MPDGYAVTISSSGGGVAHIVQPELDQGSSRSLVPPHDRAVLAALRRHAISQPWWLGYLDTGASDIVFYDVPEVTLYGDWSYVLVEAGPEEAAAWRPGEDRTNWKQTELPDLIFPQDRSWLLSTLWDDYWTCVGGPRKLIADLLADPLLGPRARRVTTDQDSTPPGLLAA